MQLSSAFALGLWPIISFAFKGTKLIKIILVTYVFGKWELISNI